jgi:hypothetical protein
MLAPLVLWWSLLGEGRAAVFDRVVASVEQSVITSSDVQIEEAIAALDRSPSPFWDPTHGDALTRLIDAEVVRSLAGSVRAYQPSDDEVAMRIDAIRGSFSERAAWVTFTSRWGLDEPALRALLIRRMVVERYLARVIAEDDPTVWRAACDEWLIDQRANLRVRRVTP